MPAKKLAPAAKPTYAVMVSESIKALGDRTGSSVQAITKQVQAHYRIDINKPALVKAIKKGVQSGTFVQIKASYKLNKKPSSAVVIKSKKSVVPIKKKAPSTSSKSVKKSSGVKKGIKVKKTIGKKSSSKTSKKTSGKTSAKSGARKTKATTSARKKTSGSSKH